jgi:hypothetical protein
VTGDQPRRPPGPLDPDRGRLGPAARARLDALHTLAPGMAARLPRVAVAFLFAAATPAELETAAQAHDAQAAQLRGPLPAALADAYRTLAGLWQTIGFQALGPAATLPELLALADPALAARVREGLTTAGMAPDALAWPPMVGPGPWPGA